MRGKRLVTFFAFLAFFAFFAVFWAWALSAPSGLSSTRQTALSIALKWTAPSGVVAGYEIQRAPDQSGVPGQPAFLKRYTDAYTAITYLDQAVTKDTTYHYRVRAFEAGFDGTDTSPAGSSWTDFYKVKTLPGVADPKITGAVVASGKATESTIEYELLTAGHVDIRVYTVDGVLVRILVNDDRSANSRYSVLWGATNEAGEKVASGTYLVHVKSPDQNIIKKIVVVR